MAELPVRAFSSEWERRERGEKRSLERAWLLAEGLGLADPGRQVLTVVGSKGKGTAAAYASAHLAAAGLRVVTVTSPGLRGIGDRIRYQGRALSARELTRLAERLGAARAGLPSYRPGGGYLSPSGLFIMAGLLHARTVQADVVVLEAGMGGISDEVSLFAPTVVGVTAIFGEHLGVLGDSPAEVARNKAGVVSAVTRAVVSLPQETRIAEALTQTVAARSAGRLGVELIRAGSSAIPSRLLPAGFGRANAELGSVAAQRTIDVTTGDIPGIPAKQRLLDTLSSVAIPGHCSWHDVPCTRVHMFADSAINRAGVSAALMEIHRRWDGIDRVLLCLPDHKDVPGAIAELRGLPVTYVRLTDKTWLSFTHPIPPGWEVVDIEKVDAQFLAACGERIAVLGTAYFIARMLDVAEVDTECLFVAPRGARQQAAAVRDK